MEGTSHIISLFSEGQTQKVKALSLFLSLNPTLLSHPKTFSTLLHLCARHRLLSFTRSLHTQLLSTSNSTPNPVTAIIINNHLINSYSNCRQLGLARQVFDAMPTKNLVSWTALLNGYANDSRPEDCFRTFRGMVDYGLLPNDYAFAGLLGCCADFSRGWMGRQAHCLAVKTCFGDDVFVCNALITMYFRCFGGADCSDAWVVFRTMANRNSITWNAMIAGLLVSGFPDSSVTIFTAMRREGVLVDRATMVSILSAVSQLGNGQLCFQLHSFCVKTSFSSEVEIATVLLRVYSDIAMEVDDCYRLFLEARRKDLVLWTMILCSCAERDPGKAMTLFSRLHSEGVVSDKHVYSAIVKACGGLATERYASTVHSLVLRSGFEGDVVIGNSLINAYARCGNVELAEIMFQEMFERDVVSWNSMIRAYAMHGRGEKALLVFSLMNCPPDSTTFVGLLSACSHNGLVDEGRKLFKSMLDDYKIVPELDHYSCMIDLLGRVGLVLEAEMLIHQMPMQPDSIIWSTLLGACRKHHDAEIAKRAAQKLMELQPRSSAGYVLMSNIYCEGGSLGDASLIRKGMKTIGVKKDPGLSWIEIHNRVHEFAVGGQRHPEIKVIYDELENIVLKLKDIGYVAETSLVVHEIEEEHKEERLLLHSEKLALVYGLMHAPPSQKLIKIMKNIRTCVDCHNFMKFASSLAKKEIVLRDMNRFHHFNKGTCSCHDYW